MDLSKFDAHTPAALRVENWDALTLSWLKSKAGKADRELINAAPDLLAEVRRLREVLVNLAAPCEAILMDGESRKWIAPQVWSAIESTAAQIRAALIEGSV